MRSHDGRVGEGEEGERGAREVKGSKLAPNESEDRLINAALKTTRRD